MGVQNLYITDEEIKKNILLQSKYQRDKGNWTNFEDALFADVQKSLKDNFNISVTANTLFYIFSKYFGSTEISKWDKTKYECFANISMVIKLIDIKSTPGIAVKLVD